MPRRKPYSERGIRRLMCYRCRERRASQQWQVCADGNVFRAICTECDVELNAMVLRWVGDLKAAEKVDAYRRRLNAS